MMTLEEALELERQVKAAGGELEINQVPTPNPQPAGELPAVVKRLLEPARDRDGLAIVGPVPLGVREFPPGSVVVQDGSGMRYIRTPRGELRKAATTPSKAERRALRLQRRRA